MTTPCTACCGQLAKTPKKWLVTGVAGFIGSNLLGNAPTHWLAEGVAEVMPWYAGQRS
jgi:hypothetical protein